MPSSMHAERLATMCDPASISQPQLFRHAFRRSSPLRSRLLVVSQAQDQHCSQSIRSEPSRRHAVLLAAGFLASACGSRAHASMEGWDGSSAALGSCPIGDEGDECRKRLIMRDKLTSDSYAGVAARKGQLGDAITQGVPVSVLDDEYTKATLTLGSTIQQYAAIDLYNPERAKLISTIKSDGSKWVSKYARGGSARKQSARKFYIVIDALQGHFAANGFAPLNKVKLNTLLANITDAEALLAKGR